MSLVDRFMTGEYEVLRTKNGRYIKGRYVSGDQETITVCGSLQPTTARELKLPEEGNRLRQYYKFFSDQPILVNSMATLSQGDKVLINGEEYRAMSLLLWQGTDLDYFCTVLWREPEQISDGSRSA